MMPTSKLLNLIRNHFKVSIICSLLCLQIRLGKFGYSNAKTLDRNLSVPTNQSFQNGVMNKAILNLLTHKPPSDIMVHCNTVVYYREPQIGPSPGALF